MPAVERPAKRQASPAVQAERALEPTPTGKLDWRQLLNWLRDDDLIEHEDAERTIKRFGSAQSAQHPLVRLGAAGLMRKGSPAAHGASGGKPLDTEALTEWLATRCGLPYLRIDPLKVDVGRVADVMSINYAERRSALPLLVGLNDVTVATCEPYDIAWVQEIEAHTRKPLKLVVVSPLDLKKYTTEFYTLSRSVRAAIKSGETTTRAWCRWSTGCGSTPSINAPRTSTWSHGAI